MRQSLVAQFIQLLQGQLSNMRESIVMEENWSLHIDQSRAHTLELLVHFVNLSAVLLRRNRFAQIQGAVMDEIGRRPPNSHENLFFVQFRLREVLRRFSGIQPLCRTSPVVVQDPLLITRHNLLEKWVIFVAQKERRRHLKTTIFLLSFNSCGTYLSNFFDFPICFKWRMTVEWSTSISTATRSFVFPGPNASLISRAVSAAFRLSLNWNKKLVRI